MGRDEPIASGMIYAGSKAACAQAISALV